MNPYLKIILRSIFLWVLICLIGSVIVVVIEGGRKGAATGIVIFALLASLVCSSPLFLIYNIINFLTYKNFLPDLWQFKKASIIYFLITSLISFYIITWLLDLVMVLIIAFFNVLAVATLLIERKYFRLFYELKGKP